MIEQSLEMTALLIYLELRKSRLNVIDMHLGGVPQVRQEDFTPLGQSQQRLVKLLQM